MQVRRGDEGRRQAARGRLRDAEHPVAAGEPVRHPVVSVVRTVLAGTFGRFVPVVGPWLASLVASALAARLSREDEYQADAFAAALMVKAGFGTAPQKALLARLGRLTGSTGGPVAWLASHPATARRIAAIEALERRWQIPPG